MGNDNIYHGLKNQLIASLLMFKDCVDRCPKNKWNKRHKDYPFSQVAFHTLFDCDLNLSDDEVELKEQQFHKENIIEFGNYDELNDQIRDGLYEKDFIVKYYQHCMEKIELKMVNKSDEELLIPNSDYYRNMTKMERYINCIRHTQHHAAQLGFRLQLITGKMMEWIGGLSN